MRNLLIISNWKLHGNKYLINHFINKISCVIKNCNFSIVIAPPLLYLDYMQQIIKFYKCDNCILLSAQNIDIHNYGSFTGEISAKMLKDIGVKYAIVGHADRKIFHKENNNIILKKFNILKSEGIFPILCIGETEREYQNNQTITICIKQINNIINNLGILALQDTIIAYEPIWAIGNNIIINPTYIQKIHNAIRNYLMQINYKISKNIIIQYGGSVNFTNILNLLKQPDIDGVLIGKASLDTENFIKILNAINNNFIPSVANI
ncbi:MAG: triose-phosphate isomerase [Candidatus Lightella neohaematopini]|nr:triose-phosphate isomerase [Candidatus Lightella neohaematopini]